MCTRNRRRDRVIRHQERSLCRIPNLYQHQVQPFKLVDPQKPGYRKILVFSPVDPTYQIPSATDVGLQQEWLTDLTHQSNAGTHFARFPGEPLDLIADEYGDTMTRGG